MNNINKNKNDRPHIVMIVPRGEAVKNFLYSDTLRVLSENARVTLLSVVNDEAILAHFRLFTNHIIPLKYHPERRLVTYLRTLVYYAHYRWLWSEKAKTDWEWHNATASTKWEKLRWLLIRGLAFSLANRHILEFLTSVEQYASWALRPNDYFLNLFKNLKPDLVFNGSHIHGPAGELPAKIAHRLGIPTVGFIFSWDNLTSRSRIFVPYDYYLVWNEQMRDQLLDMYPKIRPDRVTITGTPQFDFHFRPEYWLEREELCKRIGIDPKYPFLLYTTGMAHNWFDEHKIVELVIRLLNNKGGLPKSQLVVRTYIKDTSPEMRAIAARNIPGVVFPPVLWEEKWFTPLHEDLLIYTNLVRHASLGINAASTVSLELLMLDKPVINFGFDPPGSNLAHHDRYVRHLEYDHYRPVAKSGAVMVAMSEKDMADMLHVGLTQPKHNSEKRRQFIQSMFGNTLDGKSGKRVAECLLKLSASHVSNNR